MKINAEGKSISVLKSDIDFISLTDIAKFKSTDNPADVIKNWLRNRNTLEFLGTWEKMHNSDFKLVEFDQFRKDAGLNTFLMSPKKWIDNTNAIGITSKPGRYGGTYAHSDIAFEFASWISPEFKLYIIQDYQRLKQEEAYKDQLDWKTNRYISKINYIIHTDAVKNYLITPQLLPSQIKYQYANEADLLNVALYGMTAKQFRENFPGKEGNLRDNSTIEQLMIMNNLQVLNAEMLKDNMPANERLKKLNEVALTQQEILINNNPKALKDLKRLS